MIALTRLPISVPSPTWWRNMSPVETWGTPSRSATRAAWVPFPAPGGPMNSSLMRIDPGGYSPPAPHCCRQCAHPESGPSATDPHATSPSVREAGRSPPAPHGSRQCAHPQSGPSASHPHATSPPEREAGHSPPAPQRTSDFRLPTSDSRQDSLVVAHRELGFDLLHRLQSHTHDDEDRDTREGDGDVPDDAGHHRQHRDHAQEDRTRQRD